MAKKHRNGAPPRQRGSGQASLQANLIAHAVAGAQPEPVAIGHVTPAGGNLFADLGFEPEDAARMLAELEQEAAGLRAKPVDRAKH